MKLIPRTARLSSVLILLAAGPSGCEGEPPPEVEQATQAITTTDYDDPAGNFRVRIWKCDWVGPAAKNNTTCRVDSRDYVLIGGGAEVESTPNALLTASFPRSDLATWEAASKDHLVSAPHRLRAYAVGLRVWSMTASAVRSRVKYVVETSSPPRNHTSWTVFVDGFANNQFFVAGGGAKANWSGAGGLLTRAHSDHNSIAFTGTSKDHFIADPHTITVAAIGLPFCLPGFCFERRVTEVQQGTSGGLHNVSAGIPSGFVPAAVWGRADWSGPGRMLTKLVPFTSRNEPGGWVQSKDHQGPNGGGTTAWSVAIRTRP